MPTLDAATLAVLGPTSTWAAKLGTLVQQIAPEQVASLRITYWGKIVDLDANAITRAILRGWLRRISGDNVNFVNAPFLLERLGIRYEVVKSTGEADYTELIQVEASSRRGGAQRGRHADRQGQQPEDRLHQRPRGRGRGRGQAPHHREQRRARHDRLRRHPARQGQGQHRQHVAQPPGARPDRAHGHQPGQRAERRRAAGAEGPQGHQGSPSSSSSRRPMEGPDQGDLLVCRSRSRRPPAILLGALPFGYLVARSKGVDIFDGRQQEPRGDQRAPGAGHGPGNTSSSSTLLKGASRRAGPSSQSGAPSRAMAVPRCLGYVGLGRALVGHSFSCFTRFGAARASPPRRAASSSSCRSSPVSAAAVWGGLLRQPLRLAGLDRRGAACRSLAYAFHRAGWPWPSPASSPSLSSSATGPTSGGS
jgi:hypothetical protein